MDRFRNRHQTSIGLGREGLIWSRSLLSDAMLCLLAQVRASVLIEHPVGCYHVNHPTISIYSDRYLTSFGSGDHLFLLRALGLRCDRYDQWAQELRPKSNGNQGQ